ncbi:MAG: helix-turn-helix domain-containing protein [Clostridia bacterium]|nr:helix-turn-helix domain-containing protein [Clostridia bacterium]
MNNIKETVSANILTLRQASGMTQAELAEKLNYSDKAVSKWEHGEALPDIGTLAEICKLFGITMDSLVYEPISDIDREKEEDATAARAAGEKQRLRTRVVITLMSVMLVWLIAVFGFVVLHFFQAPYSWMTFVYAVPASATVLLVLVSVWFGRTIRFASITLLVWSVLAAVFLSMLVFASYNFWFVFLLGIPGQVIILLWWSMKGAGKP